MRVLVTGIDGFVGGHLADELMRQPDVQIIGTVRGATAGKGEHHSPVGKSRMNTAISKLGLDVANSDEVRRVVLDTKPDRIFHLAGQAFVPTSLKNPVETFRTNIFGTVAILDAVRELKTCAVLIVTSGEVYGAVPDGSPPIDESFPLNPANPYAVSKASADMIAQQYGASFGVRVVVARPFNHLGPGQSEHFAGSSFAKQIAEIKLGLREPKVATGNLDVQRDYTDVRDVVQAYVRLLDKPQQYPVFNVCSGKAARVRDLLDLLRDIGGVNIELVSDPSRLRTGEVSKIVGSAARLRAATGWEPKIPLRQTLGDVLSYWEEYLRKTS